MWQEIIIGVLIIAALVYLGRKFFGKPKTEAGCDKCAKP